MHVGATVNAGDKPFQVARLQKRRSIVKAEIK